MHDELRAQLFQKQQESVLQLRQANEEIFERIEKEINWERVAAEQRQKEEAEAKLAAEEQRRKEEEEKKLADEQKKAAEAEQARLREEEEARLCDAVENIDKEVCVDFLKAVKNGNTQNISELLDLHPEMIRVVDEEKATALINASKSGQTNCLMELIHRKAFIDWQDAHSRTGLMWASQYGNDMCVKILLEQGANVGIKDENSETALHKALDSGSFECFTMLMDAGADVELPYSDGQTLLSKAVGTSNFWAFEMLITAGANLNLPNPDSQTLCQLAFENYVASLGSGSPKSEEHPRKFLEVLIECGADLDLGDLDKQALFMKTALSAGWVSKIFEKASVQSKILAFNMLVSMHKNKLVNMSQHDEITISEFIREEYCEILKCLVHTADPLLEMTKLADSIEHCALMRPRLKEVFHEKKATTIALIQQSLSIAIFDHTYNIIQALDPAVKYALENKVIDFIVTPQAEEVVNLKWGSKRLNIALTPMQFSWDTDLNPDDHWSFSMYRRIPCLRFLVVFVFEVVFLLLSCCVLFWSHRMNFTLMFVVLMLMAAGYIVAEMHQLLTRPAYWKHAWNYIDIGIGALYVLWGLSVHISFINKDMLMSILICSIIFRMLSFSQIFEASAVLIEVVVEMMKDLANFAMLYIANILAFSTLFLVSFAELKEFDGIFLTSQSLFSFSLGNFDFAIFDGHPRATYGNIILILYLLLSSVVLLNLLIALLSVTFTVNHEKHYAVYRSVFAKFVLEFSCEYEWFPEPLCLLNPLKHLLCVLFHSDQGGKLFKNIVVKPVDFIIMVFVVIPYFWLMELSLLVNELMSDSSAHKWTWWGRIVSSPFWFPCVIICACWNESSSSTLLAYFGKENKALAAIGSGSAPKEVEGIDQHVLNPVVQDEYEGFEMTNTSLNPKDDNVFGDSSMHPKHEWKAPMIKKLEEEIEVLCPQQNSHTPSQKDSELIQSMKSAFRQELRNFEMKTSTSSLNTPGLDAKISNLQKSINDRIDHLQNTTSNALQLLGHSLEKTGQVTRENFGQQEQRQFREQSVTTTQENEIRESSFALKEFCAGERIEAAYQNGATFYSGTIKQVTGADVYTIQYDDGEIEHNVPSLLIRRKGFKVGDRVEAVFVGGVSYISGTVVKVSGPDLYTIQYDISPHFIRLKQTDCD